MTIDAVSATIVAVGQAHFNKRSQRKSLDSLGLLPTRIRRRLSPATDSNPGDYSGLRPKQGYRSPGTKTKACRMYRVRTLAHSCHGLLPPTTNHKQENHGRSSRFWYYDIKFISWPTLLFETGKSIASLCSGHPMNFFCIGGMGLQFSVRGIF